MKIHETRLFREFSKDFIHNVFEFLNFRWDSGQFIPCPIRSMTRKYKITETDSLYLILGWREYRFQRDNVGLNEQNCKGQGILPECL